MDSVLKQEWVDALRSGEYKQARQQLRTPTDNYCCLGVLCDIIDPDGWVKDEVANWIWVDKDADSERGSYSHLYLPVTLERRVFDGVEVDTGLESVFTGTVKIEECRAGAVLNDRGKTFNEIADFIEERL